MIRRTYSEILCAPSIHSGVETWTSVGTEQRSVHSLWGEQVQGKKERVHHWLSWQSFSSPRTQSAARPPPPSQICLRSSSHLGLGQTQSLVLDLIAWLFTVTSPPSAGFHRWRSFLRRAPPSRSSRPPRLGPGLLPGTQDLCPRATVLPPLLHQRDPQLRNPPPGGPVSLTILCGEREPTAGSTKT